MNKRKQAARLSKRAASDGTASKSEFAQLANVSPGRVTQWITAGQIGQDALVGEGRSARIHVERAMAQLRLRLDIGRRMGNGLNTRLSGDAPPASDRDGFRPSVDPVEEQIKRERLAEIQGRNRRAAEDELARRGVYVKSDDVRVAMRRLAANMLGVFEGSLADLASAIATRFELPQRDVLHTLRQEFTAVRARASESAGRSAGDQSPLRLDEVADATDPAAGTC